MTRLIITTLIGAGLGALLGSTRSCKTGGCPLTATPLRGAIYGAVLAGFVGISMGGGRMSSGTAAASKAPTSPHFLRVTTPEEFDREVIGHDGVVLLDFYADWCGPCQRLLPVINELADELAGQVKVVKANVDDLRQVASDHGVSSIPDVRVFVGGEEKAKWVGAKSKAFYVKELAAFQASTGESPPTDEAPEPGKEETAAPPAADGVSE